MAKRKGDAKDTLLDELESIKGLLQNEDEIPVLNEVIDTLEPVPPHQQRQGSLLLNPAPIAAPPEPESVTAQTASDAPAAEAESIRRPPSTLGENPFLPAHIRARLKGNRHAVDSTPPPFPPEPTSRQQLIQDVIHSCLPDIERRLLARLDTLTEAQLRQLLEEDTLEP